MLQGIFPLHPGTRHLVAQALAIFAVNRLALYRLLLIGPVPRSAADTIYLRIVDVLSGHQQQDRITLRANLHNYRSVAQILHHDQG